METDGALNERIQRYQKYLEKCQTVGETNEDNLLTVLKKLNNLPVTLDHLQETGIGKTVNGYRKHPNEAIGQLARSLVSKWKQLVEIVTAAAYSNPEDNECVEPEADESPADGPSSSGGSSPVEVEQVSPTVSTSSRHSHERKDNGGSHNVVRSKISPSHSSRKDERQSTSKQSCDNSPSHHKLDKQASSSRPSSVKLNSKTSDSRSELQMSDKGHTSSKSSSSGASSSRESTANEGSLSTSGKNRASDSHVSNSEQPSTANNGVHRSSSSKSRDRISDHRSGQSQNDDRVRHGHRDASDKHQKQQVPDELTSKSKNNSGHSRTAHSSSPAPGRSDHSNDSKRHTQSSDGAKDLQRKPDSSSRSHGSHHSAERSHHSSKGKSSSTDASATSHKDSSRDVVKTSVKDGSTEMLAKDGRHGKEASVHNSDKKDRSLKEERTKDTAKSKDQDGRQRVKDDDQFTKLRSLTPDPKEVKPKTVCFASLEPETYFDDPTSDADEDDAANDNFGGLSFEDLLNYDGSSSKTKKRSSVPTSKTSKSTADGRSSSSKSSSSKSAASKCSDLSSDEAQKPKPTPRSTLLHDSRKLSPLPHIPKPLEKVEISADDICASVDDIVAVYNPQSLQKLEADEDDGAAWLGKNKQNMRTNVYSGKKVQYLKEVPTLFQACMRVLMDNVDALEYVGHVPYDIMKPVFECCSPQQLYTIEDLNPQFVGETDELWEKHCKREFRNTEPSEFESWRELYLRLFDEREERLRNVTASISLSHAKKIAPMKQAKLAYVNTTAKPPRDVRRQQLKNHVSVPSKSVSPLDRKRHAAVIAASAPSAPSPPPFKRQSTGASSSSPSPADTRQSNKPAVKLVAPMMAKTLRQIKGWRR